MVCVAQIRRSLVTTQEGTPSVLHGADSTADDLAVLSSRVVCRTWQTMLTAGLLTPSAASAAGCVTVSPWTPRLSATRTPELRGGLLSDPLALCQLRSLSARRRPVPPLSATSVQPDSGDATITAAMRGILLDWCASDRCSFAKPLRIRCCEQR